MLKNKNNFELIHSFFHCWAENFSDYARITLTSSGLFINDIQSIEHLVHIKSAINKEFMFKICILQTRIETSMSALTIYKY
jgi:hypothetical protein